MDIAVIWINLFVVFFVPYVHCHRDIKSHSLDDDLVGQPASKIHANHAMNPWTIAHYEGEGDLSAKGILIQEHHKFSFANRIGRQSYLPDCRQ
ncbi:MAG: hypothetical protein ACOYI7_04780 [Candidatus Excrementavichristensenella sp.]|nr:hypothetical protein [Bacillota bacterium]NLL54569.1 hypothetical protein [Clostridiales bacterium]